MATNKHLVPFEERFGKALISLDSEYNTIRVGRANPHVLDRVMVDYYGTPTPVKQVANIAVPEARLMTITPYDRSLITPICKAIQTSEVGINPSTDGKIVRLVFPEMTEEKRKETGKEVKHKGEQAKVAIRNIRRDAMDHLKKLKKDNVITEDEQKELETELQKLTDNKIKDVDKRVEAKTKEVMSL